MDTASFRQDCFPNERGILTEPRRKTAGRKDTGNIDEYSDQFIPSELSAAIFQEATWLWLKSMPWMGTAKWVMFDPGSVNQNFIKSIFNWYGPPDTGPWGVRFTGGDYRGLCDMWRIPKASYWFVKSQWTDEPFVYIVGHWTWPGKEGKPRTVSYTHLTLPTN